VVGFVVVVGFGGLWLVLGVLVKHQSVAVLSILVAQECYFFISGLISVYVPTSDFVSPYYSVLRAQIAVKVYNYDFTFFTILITNRIGNGVARGGAVA